ncbi:MAG: flagellar export protein FliJ [Roseateles asaccharophilus]|uniref:Flagellar FliJ protein n=1 Tax=Roseateles asaccharophilus TaxID=582607 RepID=A0A4R6MTW8_9BURK|nr:flagellar export protein FliJ [Roseateles asaccharophilus]MDN3546511.1 flagellar export protein FliJ [Roseateles asaccharophilus]TDP05551.1 flagellar FliJ protein [Roseateles asaccharophilus]
MSTQALNILLERAEAERDDALAKLQELQQQAAAARTQAEQLGQYRSEYEQRWTRQFAQRTTIDIVGHYQSFGQRLDQAISQQGAISQFAEQRVERAREVLRDLELRVASVRKLIERRQGELRRSAQRREQKLTDEQAARAALSQMNPFVRLSA